MLINRTKSLEAFSPRAIGIACNTAHIVIEDIRRTTKVPVISIMEEATIEIKRRRMQRVGLLATPSTYRFGLYNGLIEPHTDVKSDIEQLIRATIAGMPRAGLELRLKELIEQFTHSEKLDGVVLGCTELPLLYNHANPQVISSLDVLADRLLKRAHT